MIILIGGSGFIGSYLATKLQQYKLSFKILDKKINSKFVDLTKRVDITDKRSLIEHIPLNATIINLAAVHRDDEKIKEYYLVNVQGAKNICEVSKINNCKNIIFFSSVAVYGKARPFADELTSLKPYNHYGKSKKAAEEIYINWMNEADDNQLTIIRPTVVFGKYNRGNVHNLISQIYKGPFFMIGNGKNIKSLAYVENLVEFTLYLLTNKKKYSLHNYVDEPQISLKELIIFIREQFGIKTKLIYIPYMIVFLIASVFDFFSKILNRKFKISKVRVQKFIVESSYVANLFGYKPKYTLKEALKKTISEEFNK
jgi:GlcNAc-P-P-Und epimerase